MIRHHIITAALVVFTALGVYAFANSPQQDDQPTQAQPHPDQPPHQRPQQRRPGPFPDLVGGLQNTDGCLGVETARTQSGKNCIFAWFENKQAAMNWYNSDMHRGVMRKFFPGSDENDREPMAGVPDDIPILAIASITFSDKPMFDQTNLPISQIAIELYTPVSGGLFLGRKFAPDALKVSDMTDYTPKDYPPDE